MTFIDHFICITLKFAQRTGWYISVTKPSSCFSRCQYVHQTLMQKNNMGIIGNDVRIK